ncbi:CaiB/BaiF CoA transferase family protein [Aestuariivirga sp.]|uniref:CaiB/BaiF CoA transferase family protein n=1 Tax=Aestuariivirga sp. TaxID=2650926 RepID=UPI0039E4C932
MAEGPLTGFRIFDLTRVLAGPYCTALLADLGAEVIKVEPPEGDEYRHIGPFVSGESALFQLVNRGKSSIVLDLKDEAQRLIARRLALSCDCVVENFRPGVAAKFGLDAESLRAEKPSLVYASISGFGQSGPWTGLPAYDLVIQALSGAMAVNGEEGGEPLKMGESVADLAGGLFASWSILAALLKRERSGEGATLDVAMHDALFALLPTAQAQLFYGGREPRSVGNRHPLSTPFGCFAAADGLFALCVLNERHFATLAALIGHTGLERDPRFNSDSARTANEPALKALIEDWSRSLSADEAVAKLTAAGLTAAPIRSFGEAAASAQATARDLVKPLPHPVLGEARSVPQPVWFDGTKPSATRAAPALDGDRDSILRGIA